MKNKKLIPKQSTKEHKFFLLVLLLISFINLSAQLAVNKDGTNPNANSILHAKGDATNKHIILEPGVSGGVGIGVTDPDAELEINGQIKITDGSQGNNKVLTSDANGLATWTASNATTNLGPNYGTVVNPITGQTWLDRNLGASQVATSSNDASSYGHLYQWGRAAEGHEIRTSVASTAQASTWFADEGNSAWDEKFIRGHPNWLDFEQDNLWDGISSQNNPCPSGFRVPSSS